MKNQRYLLVIALLLAGQSLLFGQRLTLAPDGEGVKAILDPIIIPPPEGQELYPIRPDTDHPAAYSTFWIYPDGHFETIDFEVGRTTFRNTKATLSSSSSSNIHCFLTEKYINSEPPEDAVETGKSNITDSPFPVYMNDTHTLDLFVNNDPRPNYKMVTAMSYNKRVEANNLYLFYNNVGKDSKPYSLFESPVLENILPDYNQGEVSSEGMTSASYPDYFSVLDKFQNAVHFGLKAIGSKDPPYGFDRKRIFSVLRTKDDENQEDYPFGDNANILGILTSSKGNMLTDEEAKLATAFGLPVDSNKNSKLATGLYMIGIDTLQLPIVPSHDPNHLSLIAVCREGDFLIMDYELTICNAFLQPESKIDIEISGLNGYIVSNINFTSHPSRPGLPLTSASGTFTYHPVLILAADNHRYTKCGVVAFTVKIPHSGDLDRAAQLLIENKPFINYCVKFNNTKAKINVCDFQYSFMKIDSNYVVLKCEAVPSSLSLLYPWWKYLLIVIIIIPVVWYFFRRKGPKV